MKMAQLLDRMICNVQKKEPEPRGMNKLAASNL